MLKMEQILCPVDFSEFSAKACDYAYSLARRYGARLLLEHVIQPLTAAYPYYAFPDAVNQVYWNLNADAEARLEELAKRYAWNGVRPQFVVQKGLLPDSILEFANKHGVDLIVMGTHGRRGLDRLAMGSVTEKILRKAQCPVLVVRRPIHDFVSPGDLQDPVRLRKVLLCTDFSDHARRALDYALSLAMEYNSELTLVQVVDHIAGGSDLETLTAQALGELEKPVPPDARNWCTIKSVVRVGRPYQQIIQLALETQTDLVLLGVRGRNALDLALFGSTTHRVIQLGSCPVLAVHI